MRVTKDEVRGCFKYFGHFYAAQDRVISEEFILRSENSSEEVLCYDFEGKEWRTMDRVGFLNLLNSGNVRGELSEIQETDALWYLEGHKAFNGTGDDGAVKDILAMWAKKKEQYREEWDKAYWPAKYVETTFYLNGKQYSITPDSIGLERGDCWDEGFMEYIQADIGEDLKKIGATEIRHLGFLD